MQEVKQELILDEMEKMMDKTYSFDEFMNIIRTLRGENGCPWDREQTHESLKQCLIEECYEVIEAINNKDSENLCEELGDILLQVAIHSAIAEENNEFTVNNVITEVSKKMIRRHPHVFGDVEVNSSEEVLRNWEDVKSMEKKSVSHLQNLIQVPKALPANIRAEKIQKKAIKLGLQLGDSENVFDGIDKSLQKLKKAVENEENPMLFNEFGTMLFQMIKLSLVLQINAENSLTNATNKFINRLIDVLPPMEGNDYNLCDITAPEQDKLWQ